MSRRKQKFDKSENYATITLGSGKTTIRNSDLGGRKTYTGKDATTIIEDDVKLCSCTNYCIGQHKLNSGNDDENWQTCKESV